MVVGRPSGWLYIIHWTSLRDMLPKDRRFWFTYAHFSKIGKRRGVGGGGEGDGGWRLRGRKRRRRRRDEGKKFLPSYPT